MIDTLIQMYNDLQLATVELPQQQVYIMFFADGSGALVVEDDKGKKFFIKEYQLEGKVCYPPIESQI